MHADLIQSNLEGMLATADVVDDAATKTKALVSLNQSVISRLVEIIKDDPTVDLWPRLREVNRDYKVERKAYVDESQSYKSEGL